MAPMKFFRDRIIEQKQERSKRAPAFVPAGQTTQLIVGASGESDRDILRLTEGLYRVAKLKRVYYSAYVPVMAGKKSAGHCKAAAPEGEPTVSGGLAAPVLWIPGGRIVIGREAEFQ